MNEKNGQFLQIYNTLLEQNEEIIITLQTQKNKRNIEKNYTIIHYFKSQKFREKHQSFSIFETTSKDGSHPGHLILIFCSIFTIFDIRLDVTN